MKKLIAVMVVAGAIISNSNAFSIGPVKIGGVVGKAGDTVVNTVKHDADVTVKTATTVVELPVNVLKLPKNVNGVLTGVKEDTQSAKDTLATLNGTIPKFQNDVVGMRSDFNSFLNKLSGPIVALIWVLVAFVAVKIIGAVFLKPKTRHA